MSDLVLRFPALPGVVSRIRIRRGSLPQLGALVRSATGARRVAVVSDSRVAALYGRPSLRSLRRAGLEASLIEVPRGEQGKAPHPLAALWSCFADLKLTRRDAVVALGGGVVGDVAGFAAATWLRGVPWVCVPTTLLAQVDSSVGGKTAVNLPEGKNLAGAFHQPAAVLVDPDVLATLPRRHVRAGLAEVVKMGMAVDASLFRWLERNADALAAALPEALAGAVSRSIRAKARVVVADEREREGGGRTSLNHGHTVAHALETLSGYQGLLHGEAVALGLRVAATLSVAEAGLAGSDRSRLLSLLDRLGQRARFPALPAGRLLAAMGLDKKSSHNGIRWVLTPRIGSASVPRLISERVVRACLTQAGASRGASR